MVQKVSLYTEAVKVSREFLGPAGERFLRRQITTHLSIDPEDLQAKHFEELINWIRLTFAVLTDDAKHVDDFANQLQALASPSARHAVRKRHANAR